MACCAGDSNKGAIPAFKFGKPLKDNFHDGKVHPYIDGIMKYTITKKERIRHPSGVKPKELDRLRKLMSKRSDGLDLKKEGITGAQGMAIIKDVLDELPILLFGKPQEIAAWAKACKRISSQPSSTSWSQQELSESIKLFKEALGCLDTANYLMLKYLVAFIRVLSQHPDTQAVRPKQAQAMTKYYGSAFMKPKTKKDDSGVNAKGLYFIVDNSDELYEPLMEEEIFPLKNAKMSRASRIADEIKPEKEETAEAEDVLSKVDGLDLKDYAMIGAEENLEQPVDGRASPLGEKGDVKSKISGLDIDDPRLDGLDIWMYLVHNVEQQIAETKNTINSSSLTEIKQ